MVSSKRRFYTLIEICAQYWRTYNDCLQFNGNWRFAISGKYDKRKVLIFLSTVFTCTDIYSNFSEIQKISKCLGFFCLFSESFFFDIFCFGLLWLFSIQYLFFFWLHLLPFWALFVLLIWPLLSLVGHKNNLWVTLIKIAVCTIWLIIVTYERHEQSYLSQNGFRQFLVSSQNVWQLQHNYRTKE